MNNLHIALIHNTLYALTTSEIFRDVARNVSTIESSNGINHSNGASHRTAKPSTKLNVKHSNSEARTAQPSTKLNGEATET